MLPSLSLGAQFKPPSLPSPPPLQLPQTTSTPHSLHRHLRLLADSNRLPEALHLLSQPPLTTHPPPLPTFSSLLLSALRRRDLPAGRLLHLLLLRLLSPNPLPPSLSNPLLSLYSKSRRFPSALSLFLHSPRDVVSYSAIISAAARNNLQNLSLSLFSQMLHFGLSPNEFTFSAVIQACSNPSNLAFGLSVLALAIKTGFSANDPSVGCALIDMFAKNNDLSSARKVFDAMLVRNVVVWTLLITRYAHSGFAEDAVGLFVDMCANGFRPDRFTMSSVISACVGLGSLFLGKQLHSIALRTGLASDVCVGCSLVDMYSKCGIGGSMDDSRGVFDRMAEHNVMSWTAIISGYVQSGGCDGDAVDLFVDMIHGAVRPNHFTCSSILKACANRSGDGLGEQIHARVVKSGMSSVNFVGNSLVSMYTQSGRMEEARKAFDVLYDKNLVTYNAFLDGYVKNSKSEEAFELFYQIESADIGVSAYTFASLLSAAASIGIMSKGQQLHAHLLKAGFEADRGIGNALVSMYSRCGDIGDACRVFEEMGDCNVITWTSMITGFAKHGHADRALEMFHKMVASGTRPNEVTYVGVLSACSHVGLVQEGREHFESMEKDHGIAPRMEHYACMVDLLGRSGSLDEAVEFIGSMPFKADALVWRTLLGACRVHKNVELGEMAARHILELEPGDPAAYVLLSNLYAVAGKWEEVAKIRSGMKERRLNKEPGMSWVEIENIVHRFHVGDTSHPQAREIFAKLEELVTKIRGMGYVADTNFVLHDVEDELKEQYILQHSEKIAVAFGLISTSAPRPIRVFKNLRVCGDCHKAIEFISKATRREIIVRDSNRFHRFSNGECSCGEYW